MGKVASIDNVVSIEKARQLCLVPGVLLHWCPRPITASYNLQSWVPATTGLADGKEYVVVLQ